MKYRYYVLKRLFFLIPILFGITLVTYLLANEVGDPIAAYIGPEAADKMSSEKINAMRLHLGLDKPILERYFRYLGRLIAGDWGMSMSVNPSKPVLSVISQKFPATIELALVALILSILFGIPLGIISAVRKDKIIDHVSRLLSLAGVSLPIFWLGLMLQVLITSFNTSNDLINNLPIHFRYNTIDYSYEPLTGFIFIDAIITGNFLLFIDAILHLIIPAFVLGWVSIAIISRMTRMAMIETMKEDYILMAKAKGLEEKIIIYRHALRNSIIPTLTISGLILASSLNGSVLIETVFDWPGIGQWGATALSNLDLASMMGFTIITSIIFVLSNLMVDLLYAYIDPRIRLG